MGSFTVPTGWEHYDNAKDSVTFTRVGHTSAVPNLCIIKRSVVAATAVTPSTSKYNLKYVLGVNQDVAYTSPVANPNALIDITVRHVDAPSSPLSDENDELDEILAELAALFVDATFLENVKTSLNIPTS
jgi:hypothetical protein